MKIIILNFSSGICEVYPFPEEQDGEEFLEANGFNVNNCQWMITEENILIH